MASENMKHLGVGSYKKKSKVKAHAESEIAKS